MHLKSWHNYAISIYDLLFLPSEAVGSYAENQRITAVRRVYQRGIINPMINIERLWQEYCNYEQVGYRLPIAYFTLKFL